MSTFGLTTEQVAGVMNNNRLRVAFQILQWLDIQQAQGGTTDECAEALGMPRDFISPRMSELARAGCVLKSDQRRLTRHNSDASVYLLGTADFKMFIGQPRHVKRRAGLSEQEQALLATVKTYLTRKAQIKTSEGLKNLVLTLLRDLDTHATPEKS